MKILVLGLGNPILGDDGAGWKVVELLQPELEAARIESDCVALGGLSLMERLIGFDRAVLVDTLNSGAQPCGTVRTFLLKDLPDRSQGHTTAAHDTSLRNALRVGRSMQARLPNEDEIHVVAIETENVYDFSEELSPPVAAALPAAAGAVRRILADIHQGVKK